MTIQSKPVLSESQVDLIKRPTTFLGEDGEAAMRGIQEEATKNVRLPADFAKLIESYCKDLTRRVALRELSNDLEKDKEHERLMQLELMKGEINKFKAAMVQGNIADLMRVKKTLTAQLGKYLEDINQTKERGYPPMSLGNGEIPLWASRRTLWST
jgi:hypothetical protein